ncbi:glioma pathogenesis-related protein 1-like [Antechinus flavipes]|uniref:glioma pathogenesis-related protein 1-like n=1 Tax=Antechinus flavipes TaxID=38775 RepID=UPI002235490B|nr:glioma pathogenesis-related protein 1-like [Antechinus flavipes]
MMRVSWDTDLAFRAKKCAEECEFEHNPELEHHKMVHPAFSLVGENLWIGSIGAFSENSAVEMWNDQAKNYDFQNKKCTGVCSHYTQLVWADTYKIGCAVQYCPKADHSMLPDAIVFVCTYGPGGNNDVQPYKEGEPCSECQEDTCVDQLCTNPKREKEPPTRYQEEDGHHKEDVAHLIPDEVASHKPDEDAASHKPEGIAANHKPDTEETTKGTQKVSLVLILVPIFAALAIILIIVIVIKRYFAR